MSDDICDGFGGEGDPWVSSYVSSLVTLQIADNTSQNPQEIVSPVIVVSKPVHHRLLLVLLY